MALRRNSREIVDGARPQLLGDLADAHTGVAHVGDLDSFVLRKEPRANLPHGQPLEWWLEPDDLAIVIDLVATGPVGSGRAGDTDFLHRGADAPPPFPQLHEPLAFGRLRTTPRPLLHTTRRRQHNSRRLERVATVARNHRVGSASFSSVADRSRSRSWSMPSVARPGLSARHHAPAPTRPAHARFPAPRPTPWCSPAPANRGCSLDVSTSGSFSVVVALPLPAHQADVSSLLHRLSDRTRVAHTHLPAPTPGTTSRISDSVSTSVRSRSCSASVVSGRTSWLSAKEFAGSSNGSPRARLKDAASSVGLGRAAVRAEVG